MTYMCRTATECWWGFKAPPEVHHYEKNDGYNPLSSQSSKWNAITWTDISSKRTQKQKSCLQQKLDSPVIVPCFIWVFKNEQSFPYGGWYIYLKTLKHGSYSMNFRRNREYPALILKAMQMWPCGIIPVLNNLQIWMEAFAKQYHFKGFEGRKQQGLVKCYCKIDGGIIEDIFLDYLKKS